MIDSSYALIKQEFLKFDKGLEGSLQGSIEDFSPILNFFLNSQGKKIRPALGILFSKGLGNFTEKQNIFLQAVELIHNATLFHDDVIDGADERRNNESLNKKFSNKLAILSGDYFLSCALKNIAQLAHPKINSLLAECISQLCEGELEQDLNLYKIISMEKYDATVALTVTYRRVNESQQTIPLYAYRMHGNGKVSSFMSSFSGGWTKNWDNETKIAAWIRTK